ncbi:putative toxin-antitoxin system toxin component, PIN family [Fibrobacter sp. UWH4]|uniref:putative toxin-antitoxin system toxin component, PIN family n=1 Tax=Fibrobacter sp. UWH4 TaxID=1896210 RepID=UPI00091ED6AA|nr:putative toxin-antitoxin system toxin component, PIN family [Fibrobacter sp. UWH4]SHK86031.1 putative toxin-antitoxin system toxin component, PIN family [Fibrobacter sp. UWH4]
MKYYAVIDTNVIVSALLKWNSVPGVVLQAVFNGFVVPVYNDEILIEYRNVLNRPKFGFSSELISETISQIESLGVMENALETVAEAMPDPKDIVFYSIALSHGKTAETHLVTGNIKHFPANPIVVTPRQMLDILCMY